MAYEDLLLFSTLASESDALPPKRSLWVRNCLKYRSTREEFATLLLEARNNPEEFYSLYRMTPEQFNDLLDYVALRLKNDINMGHGPLSFFRI